MVTEFITSNLRLFQMAKRQGQQSIHDMFLAHPKRSRPNATSDDTTSNTTSGTVSESEMRVSDVPTCSSIQSSTSTTTDNSTASCSTVTECSTCTHPCCTDQKPFQPVNQVVLASIANKGRNFVVNWFQQFPWLTLCLTKKKVFCFYCRHISRHEHLTFSKNFSGAFISDGFNNWKKAIKKFNDLESSHTHLEAKMKWEARGHPSLPERFSVEVCRSQEMRRNALLQQLSCLRFLLRQGLAIRGHNHDQEGNLKQLLIMMSKEASPVIRQWLSEKKYMSPEIINELISMMGQSVLRKLLCNIKKAIPHWFGIIADEATDVSNREQLNLSIRWVDNDYEVSEDPVGLFALPNTTADIVLSLE